MSCTLAKASTSTTCHKGQLSEGSQTATSKEMMFATRAYLEIVCGMFYCIYRQAMGQYQSQTKQQFNSGIICSKSSPAASCVSRQLPLETERPLFLRPATGTYS